MTPMELARRIVDERLQQQPATRHLYLTDPGFHMRTEVSRITLGVVASTLERHGLGHTAEAVLRAVVAELLDDHAMAAEQEAQRIAAEWQPDGKLQL